MCDYETYDVSSVKEVQARKEYDCAEGQHKIVPGELHWVIKGLFDGTWETSRICRNCYRSRNTLMNLGQHGCPVPIGNLCESIAEEISEYHKPWEPLPGWLAELAREHGVQEPALKCLE